MAKLGVQAIRKRAVEIVMNSVGGIRYKHLARQISEESPDTPWNTVTTAMWNLDKVFPAQVSKPSRGLFTPLDQGGGSGAQPETAKDTDGIEESDFYEAVATYLKDDLGEATEAVALAALS